MGAERTAQGTRRCRKTRDGGTGARTRDRSPCSNAPPLRFCFNTFCSSLCRAQTAPTEIFKAGSSSFSFLSVSQRCLRFSRHPGAAVRKADTEKLPASECQRVPRILRRGKAARATGTSSERPGRPEPALPPACPAQSRAAPAFGFRGNSGISIPARRRREMPRLFPGRLPFAAARAVSSAFSPLITPSKHP